MAYYELAFRLQHDCPYNDFSRAHPTAVVSHWCNWSRDVLEISDPGLDPTSTARAIRQLLRQVGSKVLRSSVVPPHLRVILQHCACDRLPPPTLPLVERRNCLNLQPMVYTDGWEHYRVTAFSPRDLARLVTDLRRRARVEVLSRRRVDAGALHLSLFVSTASLLGDLTPKQSRALTTAFDQGYFLMPRGASATEIARRLGVPRMSFLDHLRKAQNKVIHSIAPYVRLATVAA